MVPPRGKPEGLRGWLWAAGTIIALVYLLCQNIQLLDDLIHCRTGTDLEQFEQNGFNGDPGMGGQFDHGFIGQQHLEQCPQICFRQRGHQVVDLLFFRRLSG
jgi:hypothetical protein